MDNQLRFWVNQTHVSQFSVAFSKDIRHLRLNCLETQYISNINVKSDGQLISLFWRVIFDVYPIRCDLSPVILYSWIVYEGQAGTGCLCQLAAFFDKFF